MDRPATERMFVQVVEVGSFAAAPTPLGTRAGQASKLISRLESAMGVKLLDRTTPAIALTEAARSATGGCAR